MCNILAFRDRKEHLSNKIKFDRRITFVVVKTTRAQTHTSDAQHGLNHMIRRNLLRRTTTTSTLATADATPSTTSPSRQLTPPPTSPAAVAIVAPLLSSMESLPRSAIIAAQPYVTLGGCGLSLNFMPQQQSSSLASAATAKAVGEEGVDCNGSSSSSSSSSLSLRALHALPFSSALVPSAYQHLAFEALVEFCESREGEGKGGGVTELLNATSSNMSSDKAKALFDQHGHMSIWDRLGDIGTCYASFSYNNNLNTNQGTFTTANTTANAKSPPTVVMRRLQILKAREELVLKKKTSSTTSADPSTVYNSFATHPQYFYHQNQNNANNNRKGGGGNSLSPPHTFAAHPALAGVELVSSNKGSMLRASGGGSSSGEEGASSSSSIARPSTRFLDVKMSFYDREHNKPMYTALMTGSVEEKIDTSKSVLGEGGDATVTLPKAAVDDRSTLIRTDFDTFTKEHGKRSVGEEGGKGKKSTPSPLLPSRNKQRSSSGWLAPDSLVVRSGDKLQHADLIEDLASSPPSSPSSSSVGDQMPPLLELFTVQTLMMPQPPPSSSVGGGAHDSVHSINLASKHASSDGALSQRRKRFLSQAGLVPTSALGGGGVGAGSSSSSSFEPLPIPPWVLLSMVTEFMESIVAKQQALLYSHLIKKGYHRGDGGVGGWERTNLDIVPLASTLPLSSSSLLLAAAYANASLLFSPQSVMLSGEGRRGGGDDDADNQEKGHDSFSSTVPPIMTTACTPSLSLVAHNSSLSSDVLTDSPIEFITRMGGEGEGGGGAGIKYYPSYHIPPWEHRIGLPQLRGEECISSYIELWQDGERKMRGNFFFTV